ncbi:MAG: 50S ribosomal protein L23 [Chloroflexota bacterium]
MNTHYDVVRRPIFTEKSSYQQGELHHYAFEVAPHANKTMVKEAIEALFNVKVLRVNIMIMPAKRSRRWQSRRLKTRRGSYKKAIVTLAPEDTIEVFEGVR